MLVVDELNKSFITNGVEKKVLKDISFAAHDGEFICFLGPSGSGKTTLLRCIGGFEEAFRGDVKVDGRAVTSPGTDRVMVFQTFDQLFAWKTVAGNVEYPLKLNGFGKARRKEIVQSYIALVGLGGFDEYYPHQLSGGMKQRTALARALVLEPQILLMDEPFGSLDAQTRTTLQNELLKIWSELKTTVLFVTHDIEEAIILSDRIIIISNNGEVKFDIPNKLTRPRKPSGEGFAEMWEFIYSRLGE